MTNELEPELANKRGWLWKGATGRTAIGRQTWKMRFIISTPERLEYYASEPFDTPKAAIMWDDVTLVYDNINSAMYAGASDDPELLHFGLRFREKGKEYILCFRTDRASDRESWVQHFNALKSECDRLREAVQEKENVLQVHVNSRGILERVRLKIRNLVSLKKQRFVNDAFDLDLAYILPNVIAMGYPAEGREANFRNPMGQVQWFFDTYHKDRYRIYNLCSERSYPPSRFNGSFVRYPFDDHNTSPMELLLAICQDIHTFNCRSSRPDLIGPEALKKPVDFLQKQPGNVVSIHCKAGKGRTGLVICCYMLYSGVCRTAEEALEIFGARRTRDGKGVQIPSQRRYIKYFEDLLFRYHGFIPTTQIIFHSIVLSTTPLFDMDGGSDPYVVLKKRRPDHKHRNMGQTEGAFKDQTEVILDSHIGMKTKHIIRERDFELHLNYDLGECDDIQVNLWDEDINQNEYMCSFWVHAGLLDGSGRLIIPKVMIDDAVKDTAHKYFTEDFCVTLTYSTRASSRLPIGTGVDIPALQHQRSPHASLQHAEEADDEI
jgi:phosphatidylinositol-3,4,5-trisphosphate 3-phosphatase and dual-specificity protein phosphatase PTEN